jgi:hypothetical protein
VSLRSAWRIRRRRMRSSCGSLCMQGLEPDCPENHGEAHKITSQCRSVVSQFEIHSIHNIHSLILRYLARNLL